ncbi:MAG: hypothetical protein A4S12_11750 [Proteobacteria bacterium SG_bin5]|nr:hypothetical protein [Sphingomonas sp.]OQW39097.1 MAG: hypothetical protein A4S12_11750 [Proteobacteria bacterium SG_bin5]
MPEDALKPRVDFLYTAFLWLVGALITVTIAVVGVSITLSSGTTARLDKNGEQLSALNREVGEVSVKLDDQSKRLQRIEEKLDKLADRPAKR